ncbi:MAG: FAD:protein FMN transferase [Bacilli bacterium]|nr:FAD:protein FMN transferase [Bacilli bacterium]MDD4809139.1 FAD:protein FMN transferase [Bacilli bacterium]
MKKYLNYIFISLFIILISLVFLYSNQRLKEYQKNLFYMDTYINIKLYTNSQSKADKVFKEVEKIYQDYHQLTDRYGEDGGVYYINHNDNPEEIITVDPILYNMIEHGINWYHQSKGLLNINLGNVIDIWKGYRDSKEGVPSLDELKKSGSIDIGDIELLGNNQIRNNHPNLDLGAIAKGYTTEVVGDHLEKNGIDKYIINAGGNVLVGNHYDNQKYKIGIESPIQPGDIYEVVHGNNISVVTSGSYERYYEYDGKRYHHIINPNTLMPSEYMQSVTVITEDSGLADTLSTILFLMPIEEGQAFLKKLGNVEAIWFTNDGKTIKSEGFNQYE